MSKNVKNLNLTFIPQEQPPDDKEAEAFERRPRLSRSPGGKLPAFSFSTPDLDKFAKSRKISTSTPLEEVTPRRITRAFQKTLEESSIYTDSPSPENSLVADQTVIEKDPKETITGKGIEEEADEKEQTGGTPESVRKQVIFALPGGSDPTKNIGAAHFQIESSQTISPRDSNPKNTTDSSRDESTTGGNHTQDFIENAERIERTPEKMDATLRGSLTAPGSTVPAVPTFISPGCFSPSQQSAGSFINNFERCANANAWSQELKLFYFSSYLQGAAVRWFQMYVAEEEHLDNTWEQLKAAFLAEWGENNSKRDAKRNLEKRRQGRSEKTLEFYYELLYLYGQYDPGKVFDTFLEYFEDGLTEWAADQYYYFTSPNKRPGKLEELREIARAIDGAPSRSRTGRANSEDRETREPPRSNRHQTSDYRQDWGRGSQPQGQRWRQEWLVENGRNYTYQERQNIGARPDDRPQRHFDTQNQARQHQVRWEDRSYQGPRNSNKTQVRSGLNTNIPATRTRDNRPKCYTCNRPGHYAATCPNGSGRRN